MTQLPILSRIFALTLALSPAVTRGATSVQIGITPTTAENGFKRTAYLTWNAQVGCVYTVQSSTTLADPPQWVAEDSVIATDPTAQWMAPEPSSDRKFYRMLLPQPWISSVEPAVVAPGAAVDFHITGQLFETNAVLRINGVVQSNVVFTNSGLISTSYTPAVAGNYLFELVVDGQVVSAFTVTCADPLVSPELVLQGPPESPPAAPTSFSIALVDKLGIPMHELSPPLARSKQSEAKSNTKAMFTAQRTVGGSILENDNVVFEVQEGKKASTR